jgi:hypothetical protein
VGARTWEGGRKGLVEDDEDGQAKKVTLPPWLRAGAWVRSDPFPRLQIDFSSDSDSDSNEKGKQKKDKRNHTGGI